MELTASCCTQTQSRLIGHTDKVPAQHILFALPNCSPSHQRMDMLCMSLSRPGTLLQCTLYMHVVKYISYHLKLQTELNEEVVK